MHPIRKLTPCKIRSVRHSAEKLSAISQSSRVLPVTRTSGFRYLEMTAIFQTIALIWKTVFYLNYPYVYLWNACFSVACSWWLCQLLSDTIWTLYFRVKSLEYLFMRCHNHLCQNMVIFQGKSQCVFSFCAYFALFMILNPCQKKECNICSMPARASGAYKSSSRWKRSDAEIRQGIQCSYGVVFLYTVVLGGKLFYILCITKNGEIVLMLRIKLGFFPQKLLLLFPQLSRWYMCIFGRTCSYWGALQKVWISCSLKSFEGIL